MEHTLDDLAEGLCEQDATEADAMLETAEDAALYPGWNESDERRREHFREKAHKAVADGLFVIGTGWVDEP